MSDGLIRRTGMVGTPLEKQLDDNLDDATRSTSSDLPRSASSAGLKESIDTPVDESKCTQGGASKQGWRVNSYHFFGFFGMSFYAAWLFIVYFSPKQSHVNEVLGAFQSISFNSNANFNLDASIGAGLGTGLGAGLGEIAAQAPMIAMTALALAIAWCMSDFLSTNKGKNLLLTLAICTCPLAGLNSLATALFDAPFWLSFTLWLLSGLGYAALLLLYSTLLITFEDRQVTFFIAAVLIAGAAIYIFVVSTITYAAIIFTALLPILASVFFILSLRSRRQIIGRERALIVVFSKESDEKDPINWRLVADTLTYTPCLGIGIWCALNNLSYPMNIICIGFASMLSCFIIILDTRYTRWLSSKMQLKLFLPLAATTVFPLSFLDGIAQAIVIFLLFTVFILSLVTNYSAISLCVRVFELSPIRVFAYGRAFNILGVIFGYIFAAIAFSEPLSKGEGTGTILAFCALMLVFIIASTFVLEDHYPISSDVLDADCDTANADASAPKRDLWDERCAEVSKSFGLSKRQAEVLELLSKGRNTVYVQEKLVISHYTAKAHINNIYQKLGIHSRQELLDLIEQVKL
ncbi:MAG: helix-turn-helix transcriptional regulator [Coriobacteriales bacterium]|jgi:DNA-binding CsgD family transcriptional regulator|nr:helix-turn-helix transcriptional regulator [Coriobacteriales bacterium]